MVMGLCIVCVVNFLWIVWLTFLFLEAYQQTDFPLILLHTNSLERDTLLLFQFFKSANRCLKLWNVKLIGKLFGPICFEMAKMGTADLNNFYIANCVAFCGFLFFSFSCMDWWNTSMIFSLFFSFFAATITSYFVSMIWPSVSYWRLCLLIQI